MGLFDFFNNKKNTSSNCIAAKDRVFKFPSLEKPTVPQKMYQIFKEIDNDGMVFFIGTYNENEREIFYSMADSVFEYLGEFLIINAEYPFVYLENSNVDIRLIKAAIQLNYIKSLITEDKQLQQKCLLCVAKLYNCPDENAINQNNKWFTDWNNRLIDGLKKVKQHQEKISE